MNIKSTLTSILTLTLAGVAHAVTTVGYTVDGGVQVGPDIHVTQGKVYNIAVQAVGPGGAPPDDGSQLVPVKISCNGGQCQILNPPPFEDNPGWANDTFAPNGAGFITFQLRFDTAPDTVQVLVNKNGSSGTNGTLDIDQVEPFPTTFGFNIPGGFIKNADQPFPITITAIGASGPVQSFRDQITLSDDITGNILTINGSDFVNGSSDTFVTLITGDWINHVNHVTATNSVKYFPFVGPFASGTSPDIQVTPGPYDRIILRFDGETFSPGLPPGKTGTAVDQTAGTTFGPVEVYAVDQFHNRLDTGVPPGLTFTVVSDNPADVLPVGPLSLGSGFYDLSNQITFNPPLDVRQITATESINSNSSISTVRATPGAVASFVFSSQPADGSSQKADIPFSLELTAYDGPGGTGNIATNVHGVCYDDALTATIPPSSASTEIVDTNPGSLGSPDLFPDNQVCFSNGIATIPNILITKSDPGVLSFLTFDNGVIPAVNSNSWRIEPGTPKQFVFTYKPNQNYTPGVYPGNSGNPPTLTAGDSVQVQVRTTDGRWNLVGGAQIDNTTINITGDTGQSPPKYIDPSPLQLDFPAQGELVGGNAPNIVFRSAGTQVLRGVAGGTGGFSFTSQSQPISVSAGSYARMLIVGDGETVHPGIHPSTEDDGKVGSVNNQQVGEKFRVEVWATDNFWNPIVSAGYPIINFDFDDPNYTLQEPSGANATLPFPMGGSIELFDVTLESLLAPKVEVFDDLDPIPAVKHSSISVNMDAGDLHHFEMSFTIPGAKTAGTDFEVTIFAKDIFNNTITTDSGAVNLVSNTGPTTMTPTSINLGGGFWTGNLRVFTASPTAQITMSRGQISTPGPQFVINPAVAGYANLLVLMEGETHTPGANLGTQGKTGTPDSMGVGQPALFDVIATDIYFNPVPATGRVRVASDEYADFGGIEGDLTNVGGIYLYRTSLTLREATSHNITAIDVNNPLTIGDSTSTVTGIAGSYTRIQILLDGEVADPGTTAPNGKTAAPADDQESGIPFPVTIRAVDAFWNLVTSEQGGDIHLSSNKSSVFIPPNNEDTTGNTPRNFNNGVLVRNAIIGEEAILDFATITARDDTDINKTAQTAQLHVNAGPTYNWNTPTNVVAGQDFAVDITLEDSGGPIIGYGESVFLTAVFPDGSPARGAFTADGSSKQYVMSDGAVAITDLNYKYVETIQIRLEDVFGRISFSPDIIVDPSGLKYNVIVPPTAVVGPPAQFPVTIELLETVQNTLVLNRSHDIDLTVLPSPADGTLDIQTAQMANGRIVISNAYTKAESIQIRVTESATNGDPDFVIPNGDSGLIDLSPNTYTKLLLLGPGETHTPGVKNSDSGKTGSIPAQLVGADILVRARAVDQYWNTVDTFSGGQIEFSATKLDGSAASFDVVNPGLSFTNGENSTNVRFFEAADMTLVGRDELDSTIESDDLSIDVGGLNYQVSWPVSPPFLAGQNFQMTVTLFDTNLGIPIPSGEVITITPIDQNGDVAGGALSRTTASMGGSALITINDQNYNIPEIVKFRIEDNNGTVGESGFVTFNSREVKYVFDLPDTATVFEPFTIQVRAMDALTDQLNKIITNRPLDLEAFSVNNPGSPVPPGTFNQSTIMINQGVGTVSGTYTRAEEIFFKVTDNTANTAPNPPTTNSPYSSTDTVVVNAAGIDEIRVSSFTMRADEVRIVTIFVEDAFDNPVKQQPLDLVVTDISQPPPANMQMNGQPNILLNQNTNDFGELEVTFDPSADLNGPINVRITPSGSSGPVFKDLKILVLGFPNIPAKAAGIGDNRIPLNSQISLDVTEIDDQLSFESLGRFRYTRYRESNRASWTEYNLNQGIQAVDPARGYDLFTEYRSYTIEFQSFICDNGTPNPPTNLAQDCQMNVLGSQFITVLTINEDGKLAGYPSPFNPKSGGADNYLTIQFPLSTPSSVEVNIYDLFGQKVRTINQSVTPAAPSGTHGRILWFGKNDDGITVANGGYIVTVKAGGSTMKTKVLVVK